jgi:uncharacterized protein (TIGR03790 family)
MRLLRRRWTAAACLLVATSCGGGGGGGGPPPPPPTLDEVVAIQEGTTLFLDVLAGDGAGAVGATVAITGAPEHGSAQVEPDRRIRYDADAGWNGADVVAYEVTPVGGTPVAETATITTYEALAVGAPAVFLPRTAITKREVGVVVNDDDAQSVAVAAYYVAQRGIPAANVVHLAFGAPGTDLTPVQFAPLKAAVDAALPPSVQALVLTWTEPFRVGGMAITSAFALGHDPMYENGGPGPCDFTAPVSYFASDSTRPFTDHGLRPTMMLAGTSAANVFALIDRGVAADDTFPAGTAYLLRTADVPRSVRWPSMQQAATDWNHPPDGIGVVYRDDSTMGTGVLTGATDVLAYLTGWANVPSIETNVYVPGAVADHLTSYGGILTGPSGQMSVVRWLEVGATASFGTVAEPCNFTEKFPDPGELLKRYYRGGTVLEAYWKSVAWPGEGIFVGEPLARPFGRRHVTYDATGTLTILTTELDPALTYDLWAGDDPAGPRAVVVAGISVPHPQAATIALPGATRAVYELRVH